MGQSFNPFLQKVVVTKLSWLKNKTSRYVISDGKILDTVQNKYIKDDVADICKKLNAVNDATHIMCRAYNAMLYELSRIVKGGTDHTTAIATLEKNKSIMDDYEERIA